MQFAAAVTQPDGHAVTLGGNRPLPADLAAIRGVRAGFLAAVGRFVQRAVHRDMVEVQLDDLVERGVRFGFEPFEHPGRDPLIATGSQRRVRHLEVQDRFDVDPGGAGHEPDEDPPEAQVIVSSTAMTSQRMGPVGLREQRLEALPENIDHFTLERAHDDGYLHQVVG